MKLNKDFNYKKQFGQNFIYDKNFISSLVNSCNLSENSNILEIGAGAGVLTEVLATKFKKVISFEIDNTLIEPLTNLKQNFSNLDFIFNDILKVETYKIDEMFKGDFYLIANLPYYITSQIIFKFLLESKNLRGMFIMVQNEVGERFGAKPNTKEYGIPTVLINSFGSCKILKIVPRRVFTPSPKVDSAFIEIKIDREKFKNLDINKFSNFVSHCFKMKRKTLLNNLISAGFNKEKCVKILEKAFNTNIRPENLSAEDYKNLFENLNIN